MAKGNSRRRQSPKGQALLAGPPACRLESFSRISHAVPRLPSPTGHGPDSLTGHAAAHALASTALWSVLYLATSNTSWTYLFLTFQLSLPKDKGWVSLPHCCSPSPGTDPGTLERCRKGSWLCDPLYHGPFFSDSIHFSSAQERPGSWPSSKWCIFPEKVRRSEGLWPLALIFYPCHVCHLPSDNM